MKIIMINNIYYINKKNDEDTMILTWNSYFNW
jgi:hypothetical protein